MVDKLYCIGAVNAHLQRFGVSLISKMYTYIRPLRMAIMLWRRVFSVQSQQQMSKELIGTELEEDPKSVSTTKRVSAKCLLKSKT